MTIKPLLVPDHDANSVRKLLESLDAATTGTAPKQLTEMDYGGGRSPHGGHGLPRDDDDADAGKKEVIVKPETAKKAVKGASDALNKAFDASYDEKGVAEGSENLAIGEKMARDGIEYDPAREGEIISMIGDYLRRDGMTTRQVRGYMMDNDFVSDQLSYLPRKSGANEDQAVPPALNVEEAAPQLQPLQKVWAKNSHGHWLEYEVSRVRPDGRVAVSGPGGMDIFPAELLVTQRPAGAVAESLDPVEQLRADIRRFAQ